MDACRSLLIILPHKCTQRAALAALNGIFSVSPRRTLYTALCGIARVDSERYAYDTNRMCPEIIMRCDNTSRRCICIQKKRWWRCCFSRSFRKHESDFGKCYGDFTAIAMHSADIAVCSRQKESGAEKGAAREREIHALFLAAKILWSFAASFLTCSVEHRRNENAK